jgi:hypothetical protein
MKLPRSISKLLQNKIVLYIVFFLALMMLFNYMMLGNNTAIAMFILIGFLASRFSKNMIVILVIPLVLTVLFMMGNRMREGFDTTAPSTPMGTTPAGTTTAPSTPTGTTAPATSAPPTATTAPDSPSSNQSETFPSSSTTGTSTCVNGKDSISGMPCTSESMSTMYKKDNRLDYAATVEDAYADLDKILGGDGIKNLTSDTQKLMEQQTQLANAMKGMAPLLEQAKGMLQGFDLKNLDGLASMAKNFGSVAAPAN